MGIATSGVVLRGRGRDKCQYNRCNIKALEKADI
jgi:hypothetical protein